MAAIAGSVCVHVVDDDPCILAEVSAWLSRRGLAVTTFSTADAFLSALPTLQPGCVLMDLGMVPLDGCAALLIMRDYPIDWPVIMLSETAAADSADLCMLAGADLHLVKDKDPAPLLAAVETLSRGFAEARADDGVTCLSHAQPIDAQAWHAHKHALCRRFLQHLAPAKIDIAERSGDGPIGKARG